MNQQVEINFAGGLTERHETFREVVSASVYGCGRQLKAIAADLDMTSSELSRKLADNANDNVHFPMHLLPKLIEATGDKSPVYWLVEKFLETDEAKRARTLSQMSEMLPQIQQLLRSGALKAVA